MRLKNIKGASDKIKEGKYLGFVSRAHIFSSYRTVLKNISDVNKQLLDLKKMNKEIKEPSKKAGEISQPTQIANQTNNSIFVGTSADLAKLLAPAQDDTVIIEHGKS